VIYESYLAVSPHATAAASVGQIPPLDNHSPDPGHPSPPRRHVTTLTNIAITPIITSKVRAIKLRNKNAVQREEIEGGPGGCQGGMLGPRSSSSRGDGVSMKR